ncbi:VanZ family protein [Hazenella sp. IB182357]|uniref:VanZ family protein n=1 Tax=Polycladospora coralii TaxID=2771432 RepID=A0A926RUL5_9BACL|nr:VanZ family protein [Polycladospora coralii]MBD1373123.1 VanZ family protein [Polycladospora coralii]
MANNIEQFVHRIVDQLNCDSREKEDLAEELTYHLQQRIDDYLNEGFTEEEAIQKSIAEFGDDQTLQDGFQHAFARYTTILNVSLWIGYVIYLISILYELILSRFWSRNSLFYFPPGTDSIWQIEVWKINANFIPLQNTINYLTGIERYNLDIILYNTFGNVLIFIPLGIFIALLFKKVARLSIITLFAMSLSTYIEVTQFFLQIGQLDIDDVLLNTLGAMLGYFLVRGIEISIKSYKKARALYG